MQRQFPKFPKKNHRIPYGASVEILDGQIIVSLRIFKGMDLWYNFDLDKIADRLRYALLTKKISYQRAAREMAVSRDLVFDYTNPEYSESSMHPETLI